MLIHQGRIDVSPEEVGYNPKKLDVLDQHFSKLIGQNEIQAAGYLLARKGKIFACRTMGKRREDGVGGDFLPDTIRGVASITKIVTSIAIFQLIEQGNLDIDSRISQFIREFDNNQHRTITVTHLLTHTSGLSADPGFFNEPYPRSWRSQRSDKTSWIEAILQGPLLCEPGKAWNYSSAGFMILGELIMRITGQDFSDYIQEHILQPLGMSETSFKVAEHMLDRVCTLCASEREWLPQSEERPYPPKSSGGLYSTMHDLYRLGQMLLGKGVIDQVEILGRKSVEKMTTNHLVNVPTLAWGTKSLDFSYGLGVHVRGDGLLSPGSYCHEGAGRSGLYVDPNEEMVMIYIVPMSKAWVEEAMVHSRNIVWSGIR